MTALNTKLDLKDRCPIRAEDAISLVAQIYTRLGATQDAAQCVAEHLTDTSLCGMESHGLMRTLQYAEQMQSGYLKPDAIARIVTSESGAEIIDGDQGIGIPAMALAYETGIKRAQKSGISALAIRNVGHTGRHGAFADNAAAKGYLTICMGGGNRHAWPQVAPYGGARGMLPTNPWCIGVPGGERGPVVLDFATSKIAGGWIYAARSAGAMLPEGCVINRHGAPTRDPEDYFAGGAILPSGGHKGYGLALIGELIGEAFLGPSTTECNWMLLTVEAAHFRNSGAIQTATEEVLSELRNCPPAPGFERVEIPGERERAHRQASNGLIHVPKQTWKQIKTLALTLSVAPRKP